MLNTIKSSLFFCAIFACTLTIASPQKDNFVKFPSKSDLIKSLIERGFEDLVEKTDIEDIVDEKLDPIGVVKQIELILFYYQRRQKGYFDNRFGNMKGTLMYINKPDLLAILLQKDPEALEKLKSRNSNWLKKEYNLA